MVEWKNWLLELFYLWLDLKAFCPLLTVGLGVVSVKRALLGTVGQVLCHLMKTSCGY